MTISEKIIKETSIKRKKAMELLANETYSGYRTKDVSIALPKGRNAIRCKKCGNVLESFFGHDFKWCSCGAVAVDGGPHYKRRLGNQGDWEELE